MLKLRMICSAEAAAIPYPPQPQDTSCQSAALTSTQGNTNTYPKLRLLRLISVTSSELQTHQWFGLVLF